MSWCSLVISLTINLLARGKQVEEILGVSGPGEGRHLAGGEYTQASVS